MQAFKKTPNANIGIGGSADNYYKLRITGDLYVDDSTFGQGIVLASNIDNRPLISRQMNQFTTGGKAPYIGRWGLFMEPNELFLASPGTDLVQKQLRFYRRISGERHQAIEPHCE